MGTRVFNVEEEKKPRASASNTSLYRGEVTNRRDLQCVAYLVRQLTRCIHSGPDLIQVGNDPLRFGPASRQGLARSVRTQLPFI